MNEKIKIIIATHKKFDILTDDPAYSIVQVGSKIARERFNEYEHDDEVIDNISFKNPYYCELTGLYYLWKSAGNEKYLGLVHYRRYFVKNRSNNLKEDILTEKDIRKFLKGYKTILPLMSIKPIHAGARLYKNESKKYQDRYSGFHC